MRDFGEPSSGYSDGVTGVEVPGGTGVLGLNTSNNSAVAATFRRRSADANWKSTEPGAWRLAAIPDAR